MHELNICLSIIDTLEKNANLNHFQHIKKIWLEIGNLTGIELDALRFSFPIAAKRTFAENATLEIIIIEGQAWCDACQHSVTLKSYLDPCPQCGQYDYQITQGKKLRIVKMEVE